MTSPARFERKERVNAIFARQRGLISRAQCKSAGMADHHIKHLVGTGEWRAIGSGIYRNASVPETWHQRLLAACMRSNNKTWISGVTALTLHGIGIERRSFIDVTTTGDIKDRSGTLRVHRATPLPPCDLTKVHGIPVTSVERSLLDAAADLSADELEDALDEAIFDRRTTIHKVEWRLRKVGRRGKPGTAALRELVSRRLEEGCVDSRLEKRFFRFVKEQHLPKPALQHPIRVADGRTLHADFAYLGQRLIIEVMGYRWHGRRNRWERDLIRSSELAALGWRVIFVTDRQIREQPDQTALRIRRALGLESLF